MKFRLLTLAELEELETEFVRFLAAQTITGEDWVKIKAEQPERANQLIAAFSEEVFEQVTSSVEYLEFKTPNDIKTFRFGAQKVEMLGLFIEGESSVDFTKQASPEDMIAELQQSNANLKLYRAERFIKRIKRPKYSP